MKSLFLLFLLFILIESSRVDGQNLLSYGVCEEFEEAPGWCLDVMVQEWGTVWTAPALGITQEYLTTFFYQAPGGSVFSASDLVSTLTHKCADAYLKLLCSSIFRPCSVASLPGGQELAIPHSPCQSICLDLNTACEKDFLRLGVPFFDCNATDPLTGTGYAYPPQELDPILAPFTCAPYPTVEISDVRYPCPEPLEWNKRNDEILGSGCSLSCIRKAHILVSNPQTNYFNAFIVISVLSITSFVCVIITIAVFLSVPQLRSFPQRIAIYIGIGLFFLYLGFTGNAFETVEDTICLDYFNFSHQGWCLFGVWCQIFGSLVTAFWWATQSLILFWNVFLLRDPETMQRIEWFFHVVSWGYSLIAAFVLTFAQDSGGQISSAPYCSAGLTDLNWGLFVAPLVALVLWVMFAGLCSFWKIAFAGRAASTKSSALRRNAQAMILTFAFVYFTAIVCLIATSSYGESVRSKSQESISEFLQCVYSGLVPWSECNENRWRLPPSLTWYTVFTIAPVGIYYAIIFLLVKRETRKIVTDRMSGRSRGGTSGRSDHSLSSKS